MKAPRRSDGSVSDLARHRSGTFAALALALSGHAVRVTLLHAQPAYTRAYQNHAVMAVLVSIPPCMVQSCMQAIYRPTDPSVFSQYWQLWSLDTPLISTSVVHHPSHPTPVVHHHPSQSGPSRHRLSPMRAGPDPKMKHTRDESVKRLVSALTACCGNGCYADAVP